jgi:hypothetical protein
LLRLDLAVGRDLNSSITIVVERCWHRGKIAGVAAFRLPTVVILVACVGLGAASNGGGAGAETLMRRAILVSILVALIAAPALAADPTPADFENAAKYCKAVRDSKGVEAAAADCKKQKADDASKFAQTYKNLGQCVKAAQKTESD